MKRILVTGFTGQLGHDIVLELNKRGYTDVLGVGAEQLDITKEKLVDEFVKTFRPDVVFHCAAYTAVDKAEENKELCYDVNVNGTKNMVNATKNCDAKLIYISTDYVFNGTKNGIYDVEDKINPINYYGYTKELGEQIARSYDKSFIVRTSWVFGINGNNFVKTMLRLAETKKELTVVSDQIGSPTYTVDLAKLLVDMSESEKYGTYHATNSGLCSWYDFAKYIFKVNNVEVNVLPTTTAQYKTLAKRPLNSKLSKAELIKNGFDELPSWENAIERYSKELVKIKKI